MLDNQHNFLFLTILTKYYLCITFLCVPLHYQNKQTMKKVKNPFTNPIANNWNVFQGETDGNYYVITGYDKYLAVDEKQVFDDFGNVSYIFIYGEKAKKR